VDFEEEFKLPEVAELASLDSWVHLNPHILNQGRCSYYVDPRLTEEQKEALNAELAEKDPLVDRLKGVSEDKAYEALGFTANWSAGISGETVPVNQVGKLEGSSLVYGVAVLRNLVWPGAVTVGFRGGWANIYVGYGHRISQPFNTIRELKELQVEAEDRS
jgi:hypothetical protein